MSVEVLEAAESPQLVATLKGHEKNIWQVAWAPDGNTVAALSSVGEVKVWDVAQRKERAILRSGPGDSYSLAFAPDGKMLAVGHFKGDAEAAPTGGIALWDTATGKRLRLLQDAPPRGVARLAMAPDGKTIAAMEISQEGEKGAYERWLTLWDVASGKARATLADEASGTVAFSPDGKVLAWSAQVIKDNQVKAVEIRRRDLTTEQDLPPLLNPANKFSLNSLAFSPDGQTLAAADFYGNITVWDTASAKVRTLLKQDDSRRVHSLAFSPDGKLLATAVGSRGREQEPGLIELWDVATREKRLTLTGHTHEVTSVAFSPDGKLLASGSSDLTVRLWDMSLPATAAVGGGR